jgi:hypothetical protein
MKEKLAETMCLMEKKTEKHTCITKNDIKGKQFTMESINYT